MFSEGENELSLSQVAVVGQNGSPPCKDHIMPIAGSGTASGVDSAERGQINTKITALVHREKGYAPAMIFDLIPSFTQ